MVNQQFAFAVHIMTMLAFSGEKLDSQTLAASVNTNPVVVRRLLQALRQADLVTTVAGRSGGSRLRKTPTRISLLEIYEAVQPRPVIAPNERKAWKRCQVSCNMKRIMCSISETAEAAVRRRLRRIKLSELVRQVG
jgi:Rrf2 family protein